MRSLLRYQGIPAGEAAMKRLDPSSLKRKRNKYLMRLTQQSEKREKQKAKIRTDIKN